VEWRAGVDVESVLTMKNELLVDLILEANKGQVNQLISVSLLTHGSHEVTYSSLLAIIRSAVLDLAIFVEGNIQRIIPHLEKRGISFIKTRSLKG
jgi:hypothetical protein